MVTGVWNDFATNDKGGDVIDLIVYLEGKSKLEAARELATMLNVECGAASTSLTGNIRSIAKRKSTAILASPAESRTAPVTFPSRTRPDQDGKPRFVVAGDEGPRVRDDEARRHVYRQGGVSVRIKIMRNGEARPYNVYRVIDSDGRTGWQFKEPEGFLKVPYFTGSNPFDAEGPIYWPEGEKDSDTIVRIGGSAFCFGGTGDGLPPGCEEYVRDRHIVVLADNDAPGREHAEEKAALAVALAASIKIIHFPELANKQDVSDWIEAGHTFDDLKARVEAAEIWRLTGQKNGDLVQERTEAAPSEQASTRNQS
jgi:putative DNA primase/helicase